MDRARKLLDGLDLRTASGAAASWAAMAGSVREDAPGPAEAELGRLRSEGERTRRLLAEAEAEAGALRSEAAASRLRIAALEASTSWRATGPLRAVARALRRG